MTEQLVLLLQGLERFLNRLDDDGNNRLGLRWVRICLVEPSPEDYPAVAIAPHIYRDESGVVTSGAGLVLFTQEVLEGEGIVNHLNLAGAICTALKEKGDLVASGIKIIDAASVELMPRFSADGEGNAIPSGIFTSIELTVKWLRS